MSEEITSKRDRRLVYRFYTLPFVARMTVLIGLGLLADEDEDCGAAGVLFERARLRAQERGIYARLEHTVELFHVFVSPCAIEN